GCHHSDAGPPEARGNARRRRRTCARPWPGGTDPVGWAPWFKPAKPPGDNAMTILRALLMGLAAMMMAVASPSLAQDFDTTAPFAVLMDYQSGTVLYQKDADERLEPASMTKLMTLAVVFDEIQRGRLSLDEEFFISE